MYAHNNNRALANQQVATVIAAIDGITAAAKIDPSHLSYQYAPESV